MGIDAKGMAMSSQMMMKNLMFAGVFCLLATACQPRNFNSAETEAANKVAAKPQTACMSIQGNGQMFSSILGEVTALLEHNIDPVVVSGGSSGSLVSATVRSLLANPSLARTAVVDSSGRPLSLPQKAALVLGSSTGPSKTVVFLTKIKSIGQMILNVARYMEAEQLSKAFIGFPDQAVAHGDAIAGQGALLIDFFGNADFSQVIKQKSFKERNIQVERMWEKFADLVPVTASSLMLALVTPAAEATPEQQDIKQRYFGIFRDEETSPENDPSVALKRYEGQLSLAWPLVKKIPKEQLEKAFLGALAQVQSFPFVGSLAVTTRQGFLLPSPRKVWNAYQGRKTTGEPLRIPEGSILHTTARVVTNDPKIIWVDKTGEKYFYQTYFAGAKTHDELAQAHAKLAANESFIQYKENGSMKALVPKERLLILKNDSVSAAVRASISEPNAFQRREMPVSRAELAELGVTLGANDKLFTYGGWMEAIATGTLSRLDQCRSADFYVELNALSTGLRFFQEKAARSFVEGAAAAYEGAANGDWEKETNPTKIWMRHLWDYYGVSKELGKRTLHLAFNWDNPSGVQGENGKILDKALLDNRSAFFLAAYQHAFKYLTQEKVATSKPLQILSGSLMVRDISKVKTPEEVATTTEEVF